MVKYSGKTIRVAAAHAFAVAFMGIGRRGVAIPRSSQRQVNGVMGLWTRLRELHGVQLWSSCCSVGLETCGKEIETSLALLLVLILTCPLQSNQ